MPRGDVTWTNAINKVLKSSSTPLHYNEIAEQIISRGYRKSVGATPAATVNVYISQSIKEKGNKSPYMRVSRGIFTLKENKSSRKSYTKKLTPTVLESEDREEQYDIITSFGMFWRKEEVAWKSTPKLLGMQNLNAIPVDFCNQLGIYLLYDGREVIYVGRTTDRPLGKRLYEHTVDRMSTRWDRFSWFGLLPVSAKGSLGKLPVDYDAAKLIPALEAILIEALEPRQNRRRGDDLGTVEYFQKIDPTIEKKRLRGLFDDAIKKLSES